MNTVKMKLTEMFAWERNVQKICTEWNNIMALDIILQQISFKIFTRNKSEREKKRKEKYKLNVHCAI